jgi:hypothetical protein
MSAERAPRKRKVRAALPVDPRSQWEQKVVLRPGEWLRLVSRQTDGSLGQNEVEHYEVRDGSGTVVGTVTLSLRTSLKPPCPTSYRLEQLDLTGNMVVDSRW